MFNVWLIHKFRGLEIYASYGNTNLGFANDMGEERAYLLAGTGDDQTDIVVYAEVYNRAAIFSRDAISLVMRTSRGSVEMCLLAVFSPDVSKTLFTIHSLNRGSLSPTPHHAPES